MKDRSDDPSHHERTLLPQSYISLPLEKDRQTGNRVTKIRGIKGGTEKNRIERQKKIRDRNRRMKWIQKDRQKNKEKDRLKESNKTKE